jgi:hypothetical protein
MTCARCKEHEQFRHQHRDCDAMSLELSEWRRATAFYRLCKTDPNSQAVGAMRDAIEWLTSLADNAPSEQLPPNMR